MRFFVETILLILFILNFSGCAKKSSGGALNKALGVPESVENSDSDGASDATVGSKVRAVTILGGNNQLGLPNTALASPFRVLVTENQVPVADASVSFSVVTGTGGTFSASSVTTDSSGIAESIFTPP